MPAQSRPAAPRPADPRFPDPHHPGSRHPGPVPGPAAEPLPAPRPADGPYRICLVCLGNICRSPMAEVALRSELDRAGLSGRVTVDSAGTGDWHVGDPMDRGAQAELAGRGYDGIVVAAHRARQIAPSWLAGYDLIIAMDRANLRSLDRMAAGQPQVSARIRLLRSFDPAAAPGAEVPDPYDGGPDDYAEAFELMLPATRALVRQLAGQLAGRR